MVVVRHKSKLFQVGTYIIYVIIINPRFCVHFFIIHLFPFYFIISYSHLNTVKCKFIINGESIKSGFIHLFIKHIKCTNLAIVINAVIIKYPPNVMLTNVLPEPSHVTLLSRLHSLLQMFFFVKGIKNKIIGC